MKKFLLVLLIILAAIRLGIAIFVPEEDEFFKIITLIAIILFSSHIVSYKTNSQEKEKEEQVEENIDDEKDDAI